MSDQTFSPDKLSHEDMMAALFVNLVLQQTQMASIFLGHAPHPETGKIAKDLEGAKYFIDQLEMLEIKTKGNLDQREEALLKQNLMSLRMAFVNEVEKGESPLPENIKPSSDPIPVSAEPTPTPAEKPSDEDSRKKFTKKY